MSAILNFAWSDTKAAFRTAVRAFLWTTGGLGVMLFVAVLLNPKRVEPLTATSVTATFIAALVYAALPGLVAGAGAALFRLAGAWAFLPLVVFPVVMLGVFWLGRGVLAGQGHDVLTALGSQLEGNRSALGGIRVHTIELLLVALLLYGLYSVLQPVVLLQLLQYLLLLCAFIGVALLLTCMITLPPLLFAVGRRARARYASHVAGG